MAAQSRSLARARMRPLSPSRASPSLSPAGSARAAIGPSGPEQGGIDHNARAQSAFLRVHDRTRTGSELLRALISQIEGMFMTIPSIGLTAAMRERTSEVARNEHVAAGAQRGHGPRGDIFDREIERVPDPNKATHTRNQGWS